MDKDFLDWVELLEVERGLLANSLKDSKDTMVSICLLERMNEIDNILNSKYIGIHYWVIQQWRHKKDICALNTKG